MSKQSKKVLYVALLVAGVALIAWGVNDYGAFGNKFSRALTNKISDRVLLLWIAGGVLSIAGFFGLMRGK